MGDVKNFNLKDRKGETSIGTHAHLQEIIGKGFPLDGQIYHWWKGDGVHLDFTNQEAVRWWFKQLDKGIMSQVDFRPYYYNAMYDYTRMKSDEGIIMARPFSHQGGFAASVAKLNMGWCGDRSDKEQFTRYFQAGCTTACIINGGENGAPNQIRINSLKREVFRALSFYSAQVHLGKSIPT